MARARGYRLVVVLAGALLCAADRSPLEAAFGSTLVSTYPDGRKAELWLERNGDYSARGRRGDPSRGHWRISGGKLCLRQSSPFPAPFAYCTPIPPKEMHTAWKAKAVTGEAISVRLVRGRGPGGKTASASATHGRRQSAPPQN